MELPQADGLRPPRRRSNWMAILGITASIIICACCVASGALGSLALSRVAGRLHRGATTPAQVCSGAKASDTAPRDATGQFTIQPVYAEALTYAHDAAGQPKSQRVHLWSVDVLGQYPPMDDIFTSAVGGVDQWDASLSTIDPSAYRCVVLDMQSAQVEAQALKVLQKAAKEVPGPKTTAYLIPWHTDKFYGASDSQSLLIPFWEQAPLDRTLPRDSASDWFYMAGALDHEYMEVARYDRLGSVGNAYLTLLDNMVTDGLADNFSEHMTGAPIDWGIGPSEEAALWAQFKPNMTQFANPNEGAEMLGDASQGIPNGAGYLIGDHIVALYIQRHPTVTFNQLAGMDAQTIYDGSGYNG